MCSDLWCAADLATKNVNKMPNAARRPSLCPTESKSHSVSPAPYDGLHVLCSPSSSDAGPGSAWQPASGWRWPTARPCVWSSASSSGTPHVATSHGKAPQSWYGSPPAHSQCAQWYSQHHPIQWIYATTEQCVPSSVHQIILGYLF